MPHFDVSRKNMWPFKRPPFYAIAGKLTDDELLMRVADEFRKNRIEGSIYHCVYLYQWLESECYNGTIEQYFTNSTGDDASMVISFLSSCGASQTEKVLADVLKLFTNENKILSREKRIKIVSEQHEENSPKWESYIRNQNNLITKTFPEARRAIAILTRSEINKS